MVVDMHTVTMLSQYRRDEYANHPIPIRFSNPGTYKLIHSTNAGDTLTNNPRRLR